MNKHRSNKNVSTKRNSLHDGLVERQSNLVAGLNGMMSGSVRGQINGQTDKSERMQDNSGQNHVERVGDVNQMAVVLRRLPDENDHHR